jgi:hypothetical protein
VQFQSLFEIEGKITTQEPKDFLKKLTEEDNAYGKGAQEVFSLLKDGKVDEASCYISQPIVTIVFILQTFLIVP